MIFVDTGAWYARIVPSDPNHQKVRLWLGSNNEPLFTTDYIVDETLTLLRARGENRRALEIGERFFEGRIAAVHRLTEDDLERSWQIFRDFEDKQWSFTDCTSKAVIERLKITSALAFDRHFQQFGTVQVLP